MAEMLEEVVVVEMLRVELLGAQRRVEEENEVLKVEAVVEEETLSCKTLRPKGEEIHEVNNTRFDFESCSTQFVHGCGHGLRLVVPHLHAA